MKLKLYACSAPDLYHLFVNPMQDSLSVRFRDNAESAAVLFRLAAR